MYVTLVFLCGVLVGVTLLPLLAAYAVIHFTQSALSDAQQQVPELSNSGSLPSDTGDECDTQQLGGKVAAPLKAAWRRDRRDESTPQNTAAASQAALQVVVQATNRY